MTEMTLEKLLRQMKEQGKAFGRRARSEQGLPYMPEPVREGVGTSPEAIKASRFRAWGVALMWGYGLCVADASEPAGRRSISMSQFLEAKRGRVP